MLGFPRDIAYSKELRDRAITATQPGKGKLPPEQDRKWRWTREHFEDIRKACAKNIGVETMEELGWDFEAYKKALWA